MRGLAWGSRSSGLKKWAGLSTPFIVGKTQARKGHPRSQLQGGAGVDKHSSLPEALWLPREERELETDGLTPLCSFFFFLRTFVYDILSPPFPFVLREPV